MRAAAAALLLGLALTARSWALSLRHLAPVFDEVAYLSDARRFAALGGPRGVIACFWAGRCLDDNRHPLYAMLASPLMRNAPGDFAVLKLMTWACALALVALLWAAAARRGRTGAAWAAAAIAALSPTLAHLSSRVLCDALFAVLYVAALETLLAGQGRKRGWLAFGCLAGLAYLSKATGELLLLSAAALALWRWGKRAVLRAEPWLAAAGFCLTAGWLLRRNWLLWRSPFHNVNAAYLWLDDWSAVWRPGAAGATFSSYARAHDAGDAAGRLLHGARVVFVQLVDACGTGPAATNWAAGLLVAAAAVYWLAREARGGRPQRALVVAAAGLPALVVLAWQARMTLQLSRFLLPVAATLFPAAAECAAEALGAWAGPSAAAVAAALLLWPAAWALARPPVSAWQVPEDWRATTAWLAPAREGSGYLIDNDSVYSSWETGVDRRQPYPFGAPDEELRQVLRERGVKAVVLDRALPSGRGGPPRFGREDAVGPTSFLGWPRCFSSPGRPSRFLGFSPRC